jgi:hypothetical protein
MDYIEVTYPVQREDKDEQIMVIIGASTRDDEYWLERIENETGVDITNRYTDEQINKFLNEAYDVVNEERDEHFSEIP